MKPVVKTALAVMSLSIILVSTGCSKQSGGTGQTQLSAGVSSESFVPTASARAAALKDYQDNYLGSAAAVTGWTGSSANCDPGTTPDSLKQKVLQRLNYFRRLAGVPNVTLNSTYSAKAQQAALMMKDNNALNHTPPTSWKCYTPDGALASANSNLTLGVAGPEAIDLYIQDPGVIELGHRRWALFPSLSEVGTGDTDDSNALWVIGKFATRPSGDFTAYPGNGYIPAPLVYDTWSISAQAADFSAAKVTVTDASGNVYAVTTALTDSGYGDNTFTWSFGDNIARHLEKDLQLNISVTGVKISGQPKTFQYTTYIFIP